MGRGSELAVLEDTLFMPNLILKRFIKKFFKIDKKIRLAIDYRSWTLHIKKKWCFSQTLIFCIGFPIVNLMDFDDYR